MQDKSHERAYLASLLADFSVNPELKAEQAVTLIQTRYAALLRHTDILSDLLSMPEDDGVLPATTLPRMIHDFLYRGILSNAGQYRSSTEPNDGIVHFGRGQKFSGLPPSQIEFETRDILSFLPLENADSVWGAAKFYQRFVQIHPFYDANGRIGRAIVTAYLDLHGLYMNWEVMEKNNKWLKCLNDCHKRYSKPIYDTYLTYHVNHWRKFIAPKIDIYPETEIDESAP